MRYHAILSLLVAAASANARAGDLNPPGAPAPTMVTLQDLSDDIAAQETRIPIDTLTGDADTLYQITVPGSYYLRGDITAPSGFGAVDFTVDYATLDLNGYQIIGSGTGTEPGVSLGAGTREGVAVKNGTIRGFGGSGVAFLGTLLRSAELSDLRLLNNGGSGVDLGASGLGSRVENCQAVQNGANGFRLGGRTVVTGCVAQANVGDGFNGGGLLVFSDCLAFGSTNGFAVSRALLKNCQAAGNGDGFEGTFISLNGCQSSDNSGFGFRLGQQSIAVDCNAFNSGFSGFTAASNCSVSRCNSTGNGTAGVGSGFITTGSGCRFDSNHAAGNDVGYSATMAGNFFVRNTSSGNTTDLNLVAGNFDGHLETATSDFSGFDPWANISD